MLLAPSVGSYWPQFSIVGEFAGAEMKICRGSPAGAIFTNHSQEHSSSFSLNFYTFYTFECYTTSDWKLCYIQMLLNIEKCGEQD